MDFPICDLQIPHLRTSEIADKGVSLDTELKRILGWIV